MLNRRFLPAFLAFTLLLAFAATAWAGDKPKDFLGTWSIQVPEEMKPLIADTEKKAKEAPENEETQAALEMLKLVTTMEMEFTSDAVIMRAGGEERERADWSAAKNDDGSWTLTVLEKDGEKSPAKAKIDGDVLTIIEEGAEALVLDRKKADASEGANATPTKTK